MKKVTKKSSKQVKAEIGKEISGKVKLVEIKEEKKNGIRKLEKEFEEPREFREHLDNRVTAFSPVLSRQRRTEPNENLEGQVEQIAPASVTNTGQGVNYVPNAVANYNANYENTNYESANYQSEARQRRDKEMNVTLSPVRRRDEQEFRTNDNRRINVGAWRGEFTDMPNKKEEYLITTRKEERDDSLPFEQRKRRKLM